MWATIPLFASIALLVAFFLFREWEEKRGRKAWAPARLEADRRVADLYNKMVMGSIPQSWREAVIAFLHQATHTVVVWTVAGLRAAERPLARLSYRMRQQAPAGTGKGPSEFLKTMSEKKNGNGTTPESGV